MNGEEGNQPATAELPQKDGDEARALITARNLSLCLPNA
jgi:hypothetical protein